MYLLCGSFCFTIYLWTGALKVYKNNLFLFSRGGVVVGGFFILNIIQKPFFLIQQVKGRRYLRSDPRNISSPEVPFHVYQRTNFNSDFYETFLFKSRANITCSDLHDAIAVSPDTTCSSTRTWFHMSILTCTNKYMFTICNKY